MGDKATFDLDFGKSLSISSDQILYDNKWGIYCLKPPLSFRYGITAIEIYHFTIGFKYQIEILGSPNRIISIPFKTYFGLSSEKVFALYKSVVDVLWHYHFDEVYVELLDKFKKGQDITFDKDYTLNQEGLLLNRRNLIVPFEDMRIKQNQEYFSVYSVKNHKTAVFIYYLKTWNAQVLLSILCSLIEDNIKT
ncbi:MAG: hypothetical protein RJQ09_13315 [Cyclobacteriaceae bacterium]